MVTPSPGNGLALSLSGIRHGYTIGGDFTAVVSGVTLNVAAGEFVALLGPSGCGKSTLLRLVAGLEPPHDGEILADGLPVHGPDPDRILMFQDPTLYPWRNVRQNVALSQDISGKRDNAAIDQVLSLVGLNGFERAWPHQLSGGMAQRAALARALINRPKLLLLDEPLGKLDALTRLTMQTELHRLWKERGFTAIMVTHDVEEALFLATRIVTLSTRPARILSDIQVDLPFHRHRDDPQVLQLRRDILTQLGHRDDW
ncbi:ABC transporter ATP-binding protein [Acetobacter oeni]|uniref:ABC transporter ATP-binding protein n=1 Tax=Acetobacter oeni TaxID=304077 RepID=A0A511XME4_9PROT|nr:ABC transporter ATP-binding protein [Acetobacter oeni]MBB3883684.1 NitT/TauT family transport system ATP-binding protein [Acetobacter oeni]NHO19735.1 ATP-binding cassette domain-containing protein [Acetobacter oeni]GBR02873.1 nitrate/sulfonate/bicarbonate ABC transporter ATP-binding protein [Acetobacter oeni LMG 21952]GEN64117.1 ABC transporter ATP-binding protein [Acetobacter oeni]